MVVSEWSSASEFPTPQMVCFGGEQCHWVIGCCLSDFEQGSKVDSVETEVKSTSVECISYDSKLRGREISKRGSIRVCWCTSS